LWIQAGTSLLANLQVAGSQEWHATDINSAGPYTVVVPTSSVNGDCVLQVRYTTVGAITLNLPLLSSVGSGAVIVIIDSGYNASANNITALANAANKINNSALGGNVKITTNGGVLRLVANTATNNWEEW